MFTPVTCLAELGHLGCEVVRVAQVAGGLSSGRCLHGVVL